jgi:hypothetical protein
LDDRQAESVFTLPGKMKQDRGRRQPANQIIMASIEIARVHTDCASRAALPKPSHALQPPLRRPRYRRLDEGRTFSGGAAPVPHPTPLRIAQCFPATSHRRGGRREMADLDAACAPSQISDQYAGRT